MILADSSVWIDHTRRRNPALSAALANGEVVMHPAVVEELALGHVPARRAFFEELDKLLPIKDVSHQEVLFLVEKHHLFASGIGAVDAHLLASALAFGARILTLDQALLRVARKLGVAA